MSTRVWDQARPLSDRFAGAPAARRIAEHLGLPWPKVLELAFVDGRGQYIALGGALNEAQGDWLTPEYSDYVLKLVAHRLGVTTLTPGRYRTEYLAMLATGHGRARRGGQLRLPSEHQIVAVMKTWDRALAHAGLKARTGRGGQKVRNRPLAIIDVLDRCYEAHGTEPTSKEIEVFARANGIPYPRRERGKPWTQYVKEWKDRRREQGLPVPDGPPPTSKRPDYSLAVGAARSGERRAKKRWDDRDEVIEWVKRYLSQLTPGQRSSQRRYDDWARTQEGRAVVLRPRPPRRLGRRPR